jgi:hypothetical protein
MAKTKLRHRTLDDHELGALWKTAEAFSAPDGFLVRYLLLTATRLRAQDNFIPR